MLEPKRVVAEVSHKTLMSRISRLGISADPCPFLTTRHSAVRFTARLSTSVDAANSNPTSRELRRCTAAIWDGYRQSQANSLLNTTCKRRIRYNKG